MTRAQWRSIGALVIAFGLGTVAGVFGARGVGARRFADRLHGPPGRARSQLHVELLARRLDLSSAERDRVQGVVDAHEGERRALQERCAPEQRELKRKVDAEVRATLDPAHQPAFDDLMRDLDRRFPDGPPPPPFPPPPAASP